MTVREIRAHLEEIYGVEVSPALISRVTDAVVDEMTAWQTRPLEPVYLIAYLDALVIKVRDTSGVQNKSVYIVVGVRPDGSKEVLGFWLQATEGAKFWLTILTDLLKRRVFRAKQRASGTGCGGARAAARGDHTPFPMRSQQSPPDPLRSRSAPAPASLPSAPAPLPLRSRSAPAQCSSLPRLARLDVAAFVLTQR